MTPTSHDIDDLISNNRLGLALRGELCVFTTPEAINDDMRPTDHAELLCKGLYPLAAAYGADRIGGKLEEALAAICIDALGVYCAHQCFYIQIMNERTSTSPFAIDRVRLPRILGQAFLNEVPALHRLEMRTGDMQADRSYRVVLAGMQMLARDGIDWGCVLPAL